MSRIEFIKNRDGNEVIEAYCALMRKAYRKAVLTNGFRKDGTKGPIGKRHPFRKAWIEGYLEFRGR